MIINELLFFLSERPHGQFTFERGNLVSVKIEWQIFTAEQSRTRGIAQCHSGSGKN